MGINCPSCGGKMYFDIPNQVLRCEYCGTQQTVEEYKANNESEVQQMTYDSVVYTCRNCGAELTAPDEQAVAYCSYCGSEQMLTAKHEQLLRPKRIISFKKSKQQAQNAYAKALQGKLYVPKKFKDPQFLEGFRGIYLPYYSYSALVPQKDIQLTGSAEYTKGNYDYKEKYTVYAALGGRTQEVTFDASAAFDDTLANEISPFQANEMTEFHEGYLAGFYADKATTSGGTYIKAAEELAAESIYKELEDSHSHLELDKEKTLAGKKAQLGISAVDCEVSYFPVWFLTWRNKNRVAYSVMNGQTGKITMDIPVNKKMFFLVSLIAAVVIFGLLSILPMFILPRTIAAISAIVLIISSILLHSEIKKIYAKENHIYDYGDTQHTAKKKEINAKNAPAPEKTSSQKPKKIGQLIGFLVPAIWIAIWLFISFIEGGSLFATLFSNIGVLAFVAAVPLQVIFSILTIRNALHIEKKTALIPAILCIVIVVAGLVVMIANSAFDYWYFGTAIACLIGVIVNCLSAINYFNYLTTRPVPNFFRREGADNAK